MNNEISIENLKETKKEIIKKFDKKGNIIITVIDENNKKMEQTLTEFFANRNRKVYPYTRKILNQISNINFGEIKEVGEKVGKKY